MNAPPRPHPTDQILHAYGLGRLGDPDASAVDLHLEECPACRQRVSELSGDSFLGKLRDAGTPPAAPAPASGPHPSPSPSVVSPKVPASKAPARDPSLAGKLPAELVANEQYTVVRELGRGGMGVVYLAHNTMLDRLEVLKVLSKEMLERKGTRERFIREMQSAAKLDHPNIVRAYSAPPFGGLLVFAMEYIDGHDLAKLVKVRGPLPVSLACSFVHDAALGLEHAHERRMVHRDIKPGNLMYTKQGKGWTIKVLDFGLAKATSENPIDGSLTREGQMLGTVDFIAPEQSLDAQKADIRADIYSLGCTLYYLLTGGPPFEGTSLASILQAHHSSDARPLNLVRREVPVELAAVVAKMMAKETHRRYQTPEDVREALKPFCKPSKAVSGSSDGERSQSRPQDANRASIGVVSPPSEPAPAAAAPVAAPGVAVPRDDPALMWKSLITVQEPERLSDARMPAPEPLRRRPPWLGAALVVGIVLLLGLVVGWAAGVFKVKTEEGGLLRLERHVPSPQPPPPSPSGGDTIIAKSIGMKLVLIPAGEFLMGSPDSDPDAEADEKPQHRVWITRPFYLSVTEVTQGQYRIVMDQSPSRFKGSDDLPVETVSWNEAIAFCDKLSELEKGQLGAVRYRLPTEAEWEYACRGGRTTRYSFGDNQSSLSAFAWYGGNSDQKTHLVGQKRPNDFGLYDMHGNVWEWCSDLYDVKYYGYSPSADPPGPLQSTFRVSRGGGWSGIPRFARSAYRLKFTPAYRNYFVGFRVARDQSIRSDEKRSP